MWRSIVAFQLRLQISQRRVHGDGAAAREARVLQGDVQLLAALQCVETAAYTVFGHNFSSRAGRAQITTKTEETEKRIITQHGAGSAQRAAITQIDLTRVVPG